jgi:hypothetical protein
MTLKFRPRDAWVRCEMPGMFEVVIEQVDHRSGDVDSSPAVGNRGPHSGVRKCTGPWAASVGTVSEENARETR